MPRKTKSPRKAPAVSAKSGPVIRVAQLKNPKTKRVVLARVTQDGRLGRRDREVLGVKQVPEFVVVQATSWAQATKQVRAGKGKRVRAGQGQRGGAQLKAAA